MTKCISKWYNRPTHNSIYVRLYHKFDRSNWVWLSAWSKWNWRFSRWIWGRWKWMISLYRLLLWLDNWSHSKEHWILGKQNFEVNTGFSQSPRLFWGWKFSSWIYTFPNCPTRSSSWTNCHTRMGSSILDCGSYHEACPYNFARTKIYFARTKIYFAKTKISFAKTKINFARTKIYFARTKIYFAKTKISFAKTKINFASWKCSEDNSKMKLPRFQMHI